MAVSSDSREVQAKVNLSCDLDFPNVGTRWSSMFGNDKQAVKLVAI